MNKKWVVTVTSIYAPWRGRSQKEKKLEDLTVKLQSGNGIKCFVLGEFNGNVEDFLEAMMKFMVDFAGWCATEMVKRSWSLQLVLTWLLVLSTTTIN